ncbi:hypothetical protein V2A60_001356 [Cordyceps javanica]
MPVAPPPPAQSLVCHSSSTHTRSWEYFYHCCFEPVFGGSQFQWIKALIVQLGQQEDAVMSAVVAFSSMHEAAFRTSLHGPAARTQLPASHMDVLASVPNTTEYTAVTAAYSASVRALQQAIDERGRVAVPAALICCILFAALNMVQCDYDGAVCHIEHGLGILAREQSIERSGGSLCLPGWSATAANGAMSSLVSGFYRLTIAVFFYGRTETLLEERISVAVSSRVGQPAVDAVIPFRDIDEARMSLSILAGNTLRFAAEVGGHRDRQDLPSPECFRRRDEHLGRIHSWCASFQATLAASPSELAEEASLRMIHIVLESQSLALVILLRTCLDADESGYDACFHEFRAVLVLCEEYVALYSASRASYTPGREAGNFTFDMEILPQLWLVGKKCRHREYRRWCIDLLARYRRKEGVWDPRLICGLAKRTMEIEEAALPSGRTLLPNNFDRLWTVDLDSRYTYGSVAVFAYKPTALGGRGLSWEELIPVEQQAQVQGESPKGPTNMKSMSP